MTLQVRGVDKDIIIGPEVVQRFRVDHYSKLVDKTVRLRPNIGYGPEIFVEEVLVQQRIEPGPMHIRSDKLDGRVARWPGV